MKDFTEAIRIHPRFIPALLERSIVLKNQAEIKASSMKWEDAYGLWNQALEDCDQVLSHRPEFVWALLCKGNIFRDRYFVTDLHRSQIKSKQSENDWEMAQEYYRKAIERSPTVSTGFYELGVGWKMYGDQNMRVEKTEQALEAYEKATQNYSESIRLNPRHPKSYYARATIYLSFDNFELGIKDCSSALLARPYFANAQLLRARLRKMLGKRNRRQGNSKAATPLWKQAESDYQAVLKYPRLEPKKRSRAQEGLKAIHRLQENN